MLLKILNGGEPLLFRNNSDLGEFIAATGLVILFSPAWPWNCTDDLEKRQGTFTMPPPPPPPPCFLHHFIAICALKLGVSPGNPVTLNLDWWHWKTIGHLFYAPWSVGLNFIASCAGTEKGVIVWKHWNRGQFGDFFPMLPLNWTDDIEKQQGTSSVSHNFVFHCMAIVAMKLGLLSGNTHIWAKFMLTPVTLNVDLQFQPFVSGIHS